MSSSIPLVDFSGMLSDSIADRKALAAEVDRSAKEVGFMYITNCGIAPETIAAVMSTAHRFFGMNSETKNGFLFDQELNFGFHDMGKEALDPSKPADQKETFTMRNVSKTYSQSELWPSYHYRQVACDFFADCQRLADRMMSAFALALDLPENFFSNKHTGILQTLRFLHYPPAKIESSGQLGAGAHTDYGTLTLLFQDRSGGLEVQDSEGNWIPAPPIDNAVVINTGDLLARWTNDVYRSTPHRVQVRPADAANGRLSIAFFSDPDPDVLIETLPSTVSEQNPTKYAPISASDHILERIAATN